MLHLESSFGVAFCNHKGICEEQREIGDKCYGMSGECPSGSTCKGPTFGDRVCVLNTARYCGSTCTYTGSEHGPKFPGNCPWSYHTNSGCKKVTDDEITTDDCSENDDDCQCALGGKGAYCSVNDDCLSGVCSGNECQWPDSCDDAAGCYDMIGSAGGATQCNDGKCEHAPDPETTTDDAAADDEDLSSLERSAGQRCWSGAYGTSQVHCAEGTTCVEDYETFGSFEDDIVGRGSDGKIISNAGDGWGDRNGTCVTDGSLAEGSWCGSKCPDVCASGTAGGQGYCYPDGGNETRQCHVSLGSGPMVLGGCGSEQLCTCGDNSPTITGHGTCNDFPCYNKVRILADCISECLGDHLTVGSTALQCANVTCREEYQNFTICEDKAFEAKVVNGDLWATALLAFGLAVAGVVIGALAFCCGCLNSAALCLQGLCKKKPKAGATGTPQAV